MKILLTEREVLNIVSTLSEEEIKSYSEGKFKKWKGKKNYSTGGEDGYIFEYIFDENGNLKEFKDE